MNGKMYSIFFLLLITAFIKSSREDGRELKGALDRKNKRGLHYHSKRHMQLDSESTMKRLTTMKVNREIRKKPSGHLTPLEEEDLDNDEVVSVAIHPPPSHPRGAADVLWKHKLGTTGGNVSFEASQLPILIKNIFTELGRELITKHVSDDFIFGQYIGSGMQKLKPDKKLQMQHDILNILLKYENPGRSDSGVAQASPSPLEMPLTGAVTDRKFLVVNESDDSWPIFSNIATINN